ncbi:MAG TPA: hypothetical protein VH855_00295 [Acetobacteraceae bacterium]|jgi:uncharacterized membrane protein YgcG
MQLRHALRIAPMIAVLTLAACQEMDPYSRPDTWQPTGANAGNIAAMAANPYDLIHGRGVQQVDSRGSNQAIGHVWTDTPKPLLNPGGFDAGSGGGSGSGSSGGGGSGAGSGAGSPGTGN